MSTVDARHVRQLILANTWTALEHETAAREAREAGDVHGAETCELLAAAYRRQADSLADIVGDFGFTEPTPAPYLRSVS